MNLKAKVGLDARSFKKTLPLLMVVAALLLLNALSGAKQWKPQLFGTALFQRTGIVVVALLFTVASLVALRRSLDPRGTKLDVVVCAVAMLLALGNTAAKFFEATACAEMAAIGVLPFDRRLEDRAPLALTSAKPKARELMARIAYAETGLRLAYKDERDTLRVFEPTAKQVTERQERVSSLEQMTRTRELLLRQASQLAWCGYADLSVLALVLIPGLVGIGVEQRRRARAAPPLTDS